MGRKTRGQSMVEMALILPLLLMVIFGIIDLSYYVYGYSSIYQAARNASQRAATLPPQIAEVGNPSDICTSAVLDAAADGAVMFPDLRNYVQVSYPNGVRAISQPIQVAITYNIEPLTPLFRMFRLGRDGTGFMTVRVTARRSIENLGENPAFESGLACE